jgi:hypothetical protein
MISSRSHHFQVVWSGDHSLGQETIRAEVMLAVLRSQKRISGERRSCSRAECQGIGTGRTLSLVPQFRGNRTFIYAAQYRTLIRRRPCERPPGDAMRMIALDTNLEATTSSGVTRVRLRVLPLERPLPTGAWRMSRESEQSHTAQGYACAHRQAAWTLPYRPTGACCLSAL